MTGAIQAPKSPNVSHTTFQLTTPLIVLIFATKGQTQWAKSLLQMMKE